MLKVCLSFFSATPFVTQGIGYSYTDNRQQLFPFPLVTTVFSAANYCGTYTNKGALLILLPNDVQVSPLRVGALLGCLSVALPVEID